MIAGVDKFQAGNTFTPAIKRNPEAAKAVWGAPDDGHNGSRNMLSGVYATKQ
jgi:hypothetical protein